MIDILIIYAGLAVYAGFWFGVSHTDNRYSVWHTFGLIGVAMLTMPFAIPAGIVAGLCNMWTGTTLILNVVEVYDDGTRVEKNIACLIK